MTKPSIQKQLVAEMEGNLRRHGDSFEGVGWTKSQENTDLRYQVMLELIAQGESCDLLDIGCGGAHLYEYIQTQHLSNIQYSGLDMSPAYLSLCKSKHPKVTFYGDDILSESCDVPVHDYLLLNGVFNYKGAHSFEEMWQYCQQMLLKSNALSRKGFAFNFVSKYVDWERDDLFHLPFDKLAGFLDQNISRYFTVRHDYGLFEYTVYLYKK